MPPVSPFVRASADFSAPCAGGTQNRWLVFDTQWRDEHWHHIALVWQWSTGNTVVYFDGQPVLPFWGKQGAEDSTANLPADGGISPVMAAQTSR